MPPLQISLCIASKRNCASCGTQLYVGSYRKSNNRNKTKSHSISSKKRYDIYKYHGIFVQNHHNLCSSCVDTNVQSLEFEYKNQEIELPEYVVLVLQQFKKENNDAYKNERQKKHIYIMKI